MLHRKNFAFGFSRLGFSTQRIFLPLFNSSHTKIHSYCMTNPNTKDHFWEKYFKLLSTFRSQPRVIVLESAGNSCSWIPHTLSAFIWMNRLDTYRLNEFQLTSFVGCKTIWYTKYDYTSPARNRPKRYVRYNVGNTPYIISLSKLYILAGANQSMYNRVWIQPDTFTNCLGYFVSVAGSSQCRIRSKFSGHVIKIPVNVQSLLRQLSLPAARKESHQSHQSWKVRPCVNIYISLGW